MSHFHVIIEGPYERWESSVTKKILDASHSVYLTHFNNVIQDSDDEIAYLKHVSINMNRASINRTKKEFNDVKSFDTVIYWNSNFSEESIKLLMRHGSITRHEIRSQNYEPYFFITTPPTFDRVCLFWKQTRFPTRHLWWRWLRKLNIETIKL